MTYAAVRGFAEIVRRLLNAGGDVITPRWSMCSSDRAPIGTCATRPVRASSTCLLPIKSAECSRRLPLVIVPEMVLTDADTTLVAGATPDVTERRTASRCRSTCLLGGCGA